MVANFRRHPVGKESRFEPSEDLPVLGHQVVMNLTGPELNSGQVTAEK